MIMGLKQQKNLTKNKITPNIYTSYKTALFYLLEQSGHRVEGDHVPDAPHTHVTNGGSA